MSYNKNWRQIEENHDKKNQILTENRVFPSVSGLNLNDVLTIQNWLRYATAIGDTSINMLPSNTVFGDIIHRRAIQRLVNNDE